MVRESRNVAPLVDAGKLLALFALCLSVAACDRKDTGSEPNSQRAAATTVGFDGSDPAGNVARVAHGKRLAKVLNCSGCHGSNYQGGQFPPEPGWGSIHSANLTLSAGRWSDAELETIIRSGIRPDKRMLWLMPAQNYQHLTRSDMDALLAFLNELEPQGVTHPAPVFGPGAKEEIAQGGMKPPTQLVPDAKTRQPLDLGPSHKLGRYIATVTCAGCHGFELEGMEGWSPDLIVASAYSAKEFDILLTTGKPNGPRKLNDMADAARKNFVHLTHNERAALYRYLKTRAELPQ